MGWRGQDARDADERERCRVNLRGLPWLDRMAVHATEWMVAAVVMMVFVGLVWAVVRG